MSWDSVLPDANTMESFKDGDIVEAYELQECSEDFEGEVFAR